MAHPHQEHRQHKVERSRVAHITRSYATGGVVAPFETNKRIGRKAAKQEDSQAVEGGSVKERMDRPGRRTGGRIRRKEGGEVGSYPEQKIHAMSQAGGGYLNVAGQSIKVPAGLSRDEASDLLSRQTTAPGQRRGGAIKRAHGGKVAKHKGTNVNVIVAPQGRALPAGPGVMAGAPAPVPPTSPALPPRPPMMPPPGGPPMGGAPPMGPGMPPPGIRRSGGRAYAKGGGVTDGPAWNEGRKSGTQVQNNPSGKNDQRNVGRGRVVTFMAGGAVKLPGGAGGGEARLAKERIAKRSKDGMAP